MIDRVTIEITENGWTATAYTGEAPVACEEWVDEGEGPEDGTACVSCMRDLLGVHPVCKAVEDATFEICEISDSLK